MVISRIIAPVYDPVKPCCFNSQVNIYLDDFQLSKTVFILARFCPNKLFKSADKECLILIPRSDLFRPRDFYAFDPFEIQSTPDNSNLQGKSKKVRVIGSSKKNNKINNNNK